VIDNVWYVLWLSPTPRRFGWSRGPDTPPTGTANDWPTTPTGDHTVHWIRQTGVDMADTTHNLQTEMGDGTIRHFKFYAGETTGKWLITDLSRLIQAMRDRGLDAMADFMETSPRIPRVGDPN
jgi:hypothetical protein